jgi:hypothetical protein
VPTDLEPIDITPPPASPVSGRSRTWPRWIVPLLASAVVALLIGGVTGVVTVEEEPTAVELLTDARAFAKAQKTATFAGSLRIEAEDPEGGSFVQRLEIDGSARLPDQARYRVVSAEFASEVIALGDRLFTRDADEPDALRTKKWAEFDPDEQDERSGVVRPGPAENADVVGDPVGLIATLDAARRPVLLRRDGDVAVVKADVDPDRAYGATVGGGIDRATIEITLDGDRLDRLVSDIKGDGGTAHADYRFTRWGSAVEVAAPPQADLDPTPGIEEEEIAAFKDVEQLYQPRGIPEGWVLDFAGILPADMSAEGCDQVELDYIEPNDPDVGYMTIFQLPKSCAELDLPRGAEPFQAGRYSGYADDSRDGLLAQIVVGNTVVQADTDLPLDAVARILADLVPLNLAVTPVPLPGFAPTTPA